MTLALTTPAANRVPGVFPPPSGAIPVGIQFNDGVLTATTPGPPPVQSPVKSPERNPASTAPLWLQDGDVIEIPDKPGSEAIAEESVGHARVIGEVKSPGLFPLRPGQPLDLVDAIAFCKGFNATANPRQIQLTREGKRQVIDFDKAKQESDPARKIWLKPGDTIEVPRTQF